MPRTDYLYGGTRESHNKYHREYKARKRAEWFAGKVCVKCGSDQDLQMDHIVEEEKDGHIKAVSHNVFSWSKAKREAELAKCQVLCEPCHQEKTAAWYAARREHGTATMYRYCKCQVCRDGHSARRRAQRAGMVFSTP